jgi:hypothetical protein
MAIAVGLGTTLQPLWAAEVWPVTPGMSGGVRGIRCGPVTSNL